MGGVEIALGGTDEAGLRTGFDHRPHEIEVGRGLPCHDAGGGVALVGAVLAEPNDAEHLVDVGLAQAGVAAGRTAGATVETLVDAAQERVAIHPSRVWMHLDDLVKGHVAPMSLLDRIRRLLSGPEPDHPLTEEERNEHPPETAFDVRASFEQDYVGRDVDPDEPRSGRV
jgi:hypothetical protein